MRTVPPAFRLSPVAASLALALVPAVAAPVAYADAGAFVTTGSKPFLKAAGPMPAATLSPSLVDFGDQVVDTESAERTVLLRSVGDAPYVIASFCYGGGLDAVGGMQAITRIPSLCTGGAFICESTCEPGRPYAPGESCRITASFAPTFTGFFTESLSLCDNSSTGFTTLNLQGDAVPPPPITVLPGDYDFGGIPLGDTSDTARFEVRNISYGAIDLLLLRTTGEFTLVDTTCPSILYGGQTCEANVAFAPTLAGDAFGSFDVIYDDGRGKDAAAGVEAFTLAQIASSNLTGVGLAGGALTLPGPIELGAAPVGGAAVTRTVELRNTGTRPVTVASVTVSAPFTLVNNCNAPIAPGAGCSLVIGFAANAPGSFTGSLTIVSDASGGSGEVSVHATGQTIAAALVVAAPTSIGFGDRAIGTQTSGRTVSLTNIGGATANLSLAVSSLDFLLGGTSCGATLAPQASCSAEVAFRPILGFGPRTGALVVTSNSSNSPLSVILGGTSCRPFVGLGSRTGTSSSCAP
jgi:hypothetical protein